MSEIPLHFQDALTIGKKIRNGEISSVEITREMLSRLENFEPELRSFVTITGDLALQQAQQADKEIKKEQIRSPLHGVPIAIKDLLDTKGINTTYGMSIYADHFPQANATVVNRLADAGTVLLGKTKLTEGAFSRHHPNVPPPINPWDQDCWTGVSSSGSGVATAAGLCFASIGSDTGGSIRFPCAANGIVGLKPTWGRVSRHGAFPLAYSLDHIGPITRSVADAAVMLNIIAGIDKNDATSSPRPVPDYLENIDADFSNLIIGIDRAYIENNTDPELVAAINEVSACLESSGAELVDIKIDVEALCNGWPVTTAVEAAHAHKQTFPELKSEYGPLADLLELGLNVDAASYMEIELERRSFQAHLEQIYQSVDIILCPSMPFYGLPKEGSTEMDDAEEALSSTLKFTAPFDYSGSPTLSLPWRPGSKQIPLSVQLVARHFDEELLVRIGSFIEKHATQNMHPLLKGESS
jgi:amidase